MPKKGKSPTDVLEAETSNLEEREYLYAKTTGKLANIMGSSSSRLVTVDLKKVFSMAHSGQLPRGYTSIHNHSSPRDYMNTLPSFKDLGTLFSQLYHTGMIVAQHNPESGKIEGYYFIKKSKKTPKFPTLSKRESLEMNELLHQASRNEDDPHNSKQDEAQRFLEQFFYKHHQALRGLEDDLTSYKNTSAPNLLDENPNEDEIQLRKLEEFCRKYHLLFRIVPTGKFKFDAHRARFIAK
ncbi:MAG: hypothetical protein Q8L34_00695, partial [Candidatus Woesearchaeota archaeon]|nr:hypothetical protein [Candidatus Woesearchaeota archaeon]